mgnify:CR=1 FL=1
MTTSSLASLFPDEDYRFHLTLQRGDAREFFLRRSPDGEDLLRERAHWLAENPARYAAVLPEGEPVVAEFAALVRSWTTLGDATSPREQLDHIGRALEPDIVFLSADANGQFRLCAGVLCFPTGWALEEKLGRTMDFIHGVVPGLNAALASPIHQFLSKLKPGVAFFRDNWGLAANEERNHHPARQVPAPALPVALDRFWLRVEYQVLLALPETRGVVFGLRIVNHRLDEVARDGAAARGLARALRSMPEAMLRYKRLDQIAPELVRILDAVRT